MLLFRVDVVFMSRCLCSIRPDELEELDLAKNKINNFKNKMPEICTSNLTEESVFSSFSRFVTLTEYSGEACCDSNGQNS